MHSRCTSTKHAPSKAKNSKTCTSTTNPNIQSSCQNLRYKEHHKSVGPCRSGAPIEVLILQDLGAFGFGCFAPGVAVSFSHSPVAGAVRPSIPFFGQRKGIFKPLSGTKDLNRLSFRGLHSTRLRNLLPCLCFTFRGLIRKTPLVAKKLKS